MRLTKEQEEIIRAFREIDRIKINAFAGSGKTTTLVELAKRNPTARILNIVFNRSVSNELKKKMPPNVETYTIHALAWKFISPALDKPSIITKREIVDEVIKLLDLKLEDYGKAKFLVDLWEVFCESPYSQISPQIISKLIFKNTQKLKLKFFAIFKVSPREEQEKFEKILEELADRLEYLFYSVKTKIIPPTHFVYLKLFHQSWEQWERKLKKYDAIFVDEGQDLNGVQKDLLEKLPIKKKVIVGDRHQAIYGWRGAINTLAQLRWKTFYLTQTFRFKSEDIVKPANNFLTLWKKETHTIKPAEKIKPNGIRAIITRTHAGILSEGLKLPYFESRPSLEDIFQNLKKAKNTVDYFYKRKESLLRVLPYYLKEVVKELASSSKTFEDFVSALIEFGEWEFAIELMFVKKRNIEAEFKVLKRKYRENSDIILTTAHSSKGLEFEKVELAGDFPDPTSVIVAYLFEHKNPRKVTREDVLNIFSAIEKDLPEVQPILDELNLGYVAITRAISEIEGEGYWKLRQAFANPPSTLEILKAIKSSSFPISGFASIDLDLDF